MTSFAKRHNKTKLFNHIIHEESEYFSPADMVAETGLDTVYRLHAIYINKKSRYGESPVFATGEKALVNIPKHMMPTVNEILADGESVSMINGGYVGFKFYEYTNKDGTFYGVEFVDVEPK